jgi:hypothetical protein
MTLAASLTSDNTLAAFVARSEIVELTSRFCAWVDARDWDGVESLFANPVRVDYTSLNGGEPETLEPRQLVAGWQDMLSRLDATQHLIAGHVVEVDGAHATCAASIQGTHRLDAATAPWTVGGRYDFELRHTDGAWRISGLTLTVQWTSGSRQIMQPVTARQTT